MSVFSSHDIEDNHSAASLELDHNQHGAAQWFEGELFSTLIDHDDDTTLPNRVARYHLHDGEFELEQTFETECPGLHGSAQLGHYVVFGCSDGVLVIHEHDGAFEDFKIANPEGLNGRIGSLYASSDSGRLIGVASGDLYEVHLEHRELEQLDWRQGNDELSPAGYGFSHEGALFLVLDESGGLTMLEPHGDHWHHEGRIEVVTSGLSNLESDQRLAMVASQAGPLVYVVDPVGQQILEVDLHDGDIHTALELDFTPDKITWLGFEDALHGDDDHEHDDHDDDHGHDDHDH